jgi:hypothetical protein
VAKLVLAPILVETSWIFCTYQKIYKCFVSEVDVVLIHGPEKVYRGRVATGNTLCWWLHSLSFYYYCKLIGGFFMIVHTIQWIFGLLLSLILLFENASGGAA